MKTRIILGLTMAVILAGLMWLDHSLEHRPASTDSAWQADAFTGAPMAAVLAVVAVMGFVEVARMARRAKIEVLWVTGLAACVALATSPFWLAGAFSSPPGADDAIVAMGLMLLAVFVEQMIRHRTDDALRRVAGTILAVTYLGLGLGAILAIRLNYGVPVLFLFLAAVKCTDVGAYFTGRAIGKHKMVPSISPGKTWEGLAGGLVFAAGAALGVRWVCAIEIVTPVQTVVLGVVLGVTGQVGDLCESLLKRSTAVKDSGSLLPEFGGALDILDSPLIAAPVAYLLLAIMA